MILRPGDSGQFQVIGEAYVHGLEDAVGILGPLPRNWRVVISGDAFGRPLHRYLNLRTFKQTAEDPRLGPLPSEWKRVAYERSSDDPAFFEVFSSSATGETITSDPRLSPEALKLRGVKLETFQLS
jgi:hypothetical protein